MIPYNLKHRPVVCIDDYDTIDGPYAQNGTDVRSIDLGLAQWDPYDISAKVWRFVGSEEGGKWSRQSEELPLHRVLDLAILIAEAVKLSKEAQTSGKYEGTFPQLQGKELKIETGKEYEDGPDIKSNLAKSFAGALERENKEYLAERFAVLASLLKGMGYKGDES